MRSTHPAPTTTSDGSLEYPRRLCADPGTRNPLCGQKRRVKERLVAALHAPLLALATHRESERAAAVQVDAKKTHTVVQPKWLGMKLTEQDRQRLLRFSLGDRRQAGHHGEGEQPSR